MKFSNNIGLIILLAATSFVGACSTTGMSVTQQSKPGFSNITDIPIPDSANMNMNNSMVMGGGDSWTGHLVYDTKKPQADVVDFNNTQMQSSGWTKVSELRGKVTVMTFIKNQRVATIRITTNEGYITNQTVVSVDMTKSSLKHIKNAVVNATDSE